MGRKDKLSYDWAKKIDTRVLRTCPLCGANALFTSITKEQYYKADLQILGRRSEGIINKNLYMVKCLSFWCGNIMTAYNESPKIARAFWNALEGPGRKIA